jgi:hypothetical protein
MWKDKNMQPVDTNSYRYLSGTAAGTSCLIDNPVNLNRLIFGTPTTGTAWIYDNAAGDGSGNLIYTFLGTTTYKQVDLDLKLQKGLTYATSGTTNVIVTYS